MKNKFKLIFTKVSKVEKFLLRVIHLIVKMVDRSNSTFEGAPCALPFIEVTPKGEIQVSSQAMLMLSQLKTKPVAVVTFAGLAKTGKSYLANQFV